MRKHVVVILVVVLSICAGCGANREENNDNKDKAGIQERSQNMDESENERSRIEDETAMQEEQPNLAMGEDTTKDPDFNSVVINTKYIPVAYRQNALIVQRSEDMELYGLLNNQGEVILEPEYDALNFVFMNGKDYIEVTLGDDKGILDLEGKECIEIGQYDDIVSAGDAGWLVLQDGKHWENMGKKYVGIEGGKQYLLDENGNVLKEFNSTYECCFGNRYLFCSDLELGAGIMRNIEGGGSCELNLPYGKVYDLDENLLLSWDEMDITAFQWLIDGDKLGVFRRGKGLQLIDMNGNIISELGDLETYIVEPVIDKQTIILRYSGIEGIDNNISEFNLSLNTITETEFAHEDAWDAQIVVKQSGDFYQFYKDGNSLFEERFVDYSFDEGVLWLENIDSEWGIVDYDGNIIIPFGQIDSRDSYLDDGNLSFLSSKGMFGFYLKQSEGYEFHNYMVAEGRLSQVE